MRRDAYSHPFAIVGVNRKTIVVGLAATMGGLTAFMVMVGVVFSPFFFLLALPFGGATYVMWHHATGRLDFTRTRGEAAGGTRFQEGRNVSVNRATRSDQKRHSPGDQWGPRGPSTEWNRSKAEGGWTKRGSKEQNTPRRTGPRLSSQEARRILGVETESSISDLKAVYRRRVKEVHPDTESGSEEAFKRVNRAYEALRDE